MRNGLRAVTVFLGVALLSFRSSCADLESPILAIEQAIEAGDLDAASTMISAGLQHHPSGGLYNLRGVVHARRDELAEAHEDFEQAVRLTPGLVPAWQNLARACRMEAEQKPVSMICAVSASEQVLRLKPDDTEARAGLALLLEKKGQYRQSLSELARLPTRNLSETMNSLVRCADLAGLGRTAEAMQTAARLAADISLSPALLASVEPAFTTRDSAAVLICILKGLDSRGASDAATLRPLAVAYERADQAAEARATLERVARLEPKNPAHLLELARVAENAGDHEGALGYLAHARDLEPNDAQVHFLFAMVASKMDLPVEARASLDRALQLDPDNPTYNFAMGTVILTTRDAASATTYFKKFIADRPDDPKGHYALGVADFASGDYANAKVEIRSVENDTKLSGAAAYFLGRMALIDDDTKDAAVQLRRSISLMPNYAECHTELARVYLREERTIEARAELRRALELDPRSFQANSQLLLLYKRTHDARAGGQAGLVKQLDEQRSKRAELMLRTIELRP